MVGFERNLEYNSCWNWPWPSLLSLCGCSILLQHPAILWSFLLDCLNTLPGSSALLWKVACLLQVPAGCEVFIFLLTTHYCSHAAEFWGPSLFLPFPVLLSPYPASPWHTGQTRLAPSAQHHSFKKVGWRMGIKPENSTAQITKSQWNQVWQLLGLTHLSPAGHFVPDYSLSGDFTPYLPLLPMQEPQARFPMIRRIVYILATLLHRVISFILSNHSGLAPHGCYINAINCEA